MESKTLFAIAKTTTKEWLRAYRAWFESPAAASNPLAQIFQLQTAVRVGDQALARDLRSKISPVFTSLAAGRQILEEADAFLKMQDGRPISSELSGRTLGRLFLENRRYVEALTCWLSIQDNAALEERELRLAQIYTKLGEYRKAVLKIEACSQTKYADRVPPLLQECEVGLQRVERLENRRPSQLPHPLLKELLEAIVSSESHPLPTQALLAFAWNELLGEWSDFTLVLRHGLVAGDELILRELPLSAEAGLRTFVESPAFANAASPRLVDHVRRCLMQRNFADAADLLAGNNSALLQSPP